MHASLTDDADPWVAPLEAKASGFMEMPLDGDLPGAGAGPDPDVKPDAIPDVNPDARADANAEDSLPLGAWVQLRVDSHWIRTQLTWASPQGTLFLFTSASGSTQSMTRRSRNKLFAAGRMRAIEDHPVLDVALDAVCQTALFNSLGGVSDSRLGETRFS